MSNNNVSFSFSGAGCRSVLWLQYDYALRIMQELRSLECREPAFLRFVNLTDRVVELYWISYTGQYIMHKLPKKGDFIDVNTYKTHPWRAIDSKTSDRLHVNKLYVYYPKTIQEYFAEQHPGKLLPLNFQARIPVNITSPLLSLKLLAMLKIRNRLQTSDQVDTLNLPRNLKRDLKASIDTRNNKTYW